jgi:hypothetical protein
MSASVCWRHCMHGSSYSKNIPVELAAEAFAVAILTLESELSTRIRLDLNKRNSKFQPKLRPWRIRSRFSSFGTSSLNRHLVYNDYGVMATGTLRSVQEREKMASPKGLTAPAMVFVISMLAAVPSSACLRTPSLAIVDGFLSNTKLSPPDRAKAIELRADLVELLAHRNQGRLTERSETTRAALQVEAQIMDMLGFRLVPTRGWGRGVPSLGAQGELKHLP